MPAEDDVLRIGLVSSGWFGLTACFGTVALFAAAGAWRTATDAAQLWLLGAAGVSALLAAVTGGRLWMIKRLRPTGLRVDAKGLSGYVLDAPVAWRDIRKVGLVVLARDGQPAVALSLYDPRAHAGRVRTGLAPLDEAEPWHYHVLLRGGLEMQARDLAHLLQDWHRRHGPRGL